MRRLADFAPHPLSSAACPLKPKHTNPKTLPPLPRPQAVGLSVRKECVVVCKLDGRVRIHALARGRCFEWREGAGVCG